MGKKTRLGNEPDYNYWAQFALWEFEQFVALSLGLDPDIVSSQTVKARDFPVDLRSDYEKQFALFHSHRNAARFNNPHSNPPVHYLSWARTNGLKYPAALEAAVRQRGEIIVNWREENEKSSAKLREESEAHKTDLQRGQSNIERLQRENDALRRELVRLNRESEKHASEKPELTEAERRVARTIVIAMAVGGYGYDAAKERSDTVKQILDDVEKIGLRVDDNTIRRWLRDSAALLRKVGGGQSDAS